MKRLKSFVRTSILGGTTVILPLAIFAFVFKWIFKIVTDIIQPGTNMVRARTPLPETVADVTVVLIILLTCFLVGVIVRTKFGGVFFRTMDGWLMKLPFYSLIKETVLQFFGSETTPFSAVVLVRLSDNGPLMTAFMTDSHPDGLVTVFVPTGPNPTSGNILHLPAGQVHRVDVPVEDAMRSIISCGAGSRKLIDAMARAEKKLLDAKVGEAEARDASLLSRVRENADGG